MTRWSPMAKWPWTIHCRAPFGVGARFLWKTIHSKRRRRTSSVVRARTSSIVGTARREHPQAGEAAEQLGRLPLSLRLSGSETGLKVPRLAAETAEDRLGLPELAFVLEPVLLEKLALLRHSTRFPRVLRRVVGPAQEFWISHRPTPSSRRPRALPAWPPWPRPWTGSRRPRARRPVQPLPCPPPRLRPSRPS